jgi:hypothetical protein
MFQNEKLNRIESMCLGVVFLICGNCLLPIVMRI